MSKYKTVTLSKFCPYPYKTAVKIEITCSITINIYNKIPVICMVKFLIMFLQRITICN